MKRPLRIITLLAVLSLCIPVQSAVRRVQTDRPVVALTFDDGPDAVYTDQVLNVLAESNVKATFFLIGKQVEAHPATARRIVKNGHEIGGHSYDWSSWVFKSNRQIRQHLHKMESAFSNAGISEIRWFRAPNGILLPWQKSVLKNRGWVHVLADVIPGDWENKTEEQISDCVLERVNPGSIIVLHDGGGDRTATIKALPKIIQILKRQGYTFLTVSQLLRYQ